MLHPVQDFWKLNAITAKNKYPLLLINELIDKLKGTKYYMKLDIQWGYNNVHIKEDKKWKAAFQTNRGLFKPLVMFFGLCNSPATLQTMMNHIFQDLLNWGKVVIYMNDIMIFTETLEEHHKIVQRDSISQINNSLQSGQRISHKSERSNWMAHIKNMWRVKRFLWIPELLLSLS